VRTRPLAIVAWTLVGLLALSAVYGAVGSWYAAQLLDGTLRVGAPTAQSSGWPPAEGPADIGYVGDPQAAFGYAYQDVSLDGELGAFPAWLIPPPGGALDVPWAVFVHGIGGRRENGYRFLPALHEAGYAVLMISYRNDRDAPADPSGVYAFGLTEWRDLDAAVSHALDTGASSVAVVAESMGGGIAGQFLRRSEHKAAATALVLDAPAVDLHAILVDQIGRMGLPFPSLLARGALRFSGFALPVKLDEAATAAEFAGFPGPIFLSHGSADRVVPVSSSDDFVAKRTAVTDYVRTTADHIQSWKQDPRRYEASLRAFLSVTAAENGN
jgi:uncharacterized protein